MDAYVATLFGRQGLELVLRVALSKKLDPTLKSREQDGFIIIKV
jgi:hypothetical protein